MGRRVLQLHLGHTTGPKRMLAVVFCLRPQAKKMSTVSCYSFSSHRQRVTKEVKLRKYQQTSYFPSLTIDLGR